MYRSFLLAAAALFLTTAGWSAAPLRVITTTTDLASIARQIGGEQVTVESLSVGSQNPHFVEAKPSFIVKLMKADLFIQTGMDLEVGWAPLLIQNARNKNLFPGGRGHLDASEHVEPLEVPTQVSRAMGDVHPAGNPHYLADPKNALIVADRIVHKLAELAPEHRAAFEARSAAFKKDVENRLGAWTETLRPFHGQPFVSYHRDWVYFAQRFGLVSAGELEPKPGIPPTGPHLAALIASMKAKNIKLIIIDPWYERRSSDYVAQQTGARVAELALFPGGVKGSETYQDTIDHNVKAVAAALSAAGPANR